MASRLADSLTVQGRFVSITLELLRPDQDVQQVQEPESGHYSTEDVLKRHNSPPSFAQNTAKAAANAKNRKGASTHKISSTDGLLSPGHSYPGNSTPASPFTIRSNASIGNGFGRYASGLNSSRRSGLTRTADTITVGT